MTNENTTDTNITLTHREVKRNELAEDRAKALEKVAKIDQKIADLDRESANEEAIEALAPGTNVAYVYGRALNKRVLNGLVRAVAKNDKGLVQLKVETGEGLDIELHIIDSTALLFDAAAVDAAAQEIADAKAEAARLAEEASAKKASEGGAA